MKPGNAPLKSVRLLDQVRERIRYLHYSLSTEKVYLHWVKFIIRWQAQQVGGMRHPREMGSPEVQAFLTMLAVERKVSASTHNQALSAILFLYREVLAIKLPWLDDIGRPHSKRRIPSVLTRLLDGTGTRWRPNTPKSAKLGDGSGCFRRLRCQLTRVVALSVGITCLRSGCNAR